jgi:hypothetical protein
MMAAWKQIAFETLFATGMVAATAYILFVSLKSGVVVGKWPGQICKRSERPILYWVGVAAYAFCFACSIYIFVIIFKGDFFGPKWPTLPGNHN